MPKKGVLQKLNPKSNGKVQKSKAQKSMTLVATSEMLTEREYIYEQDLVVHTLDQGIDRNMIKTEEIKLEAEEVEGEDINEFSTNSVHITSDKLIKNEPESFLGTEAFSHPRPTKSIASIPARKKRKNVAKEMLKIAEQQQKRQEKRAKNSNRHKENTAQLPDYRELAQCHNQELSDTSINNNAVESFDEIQRNVTESSNIEPEVSLGTLSNNVSSHDDSNEMGRENDTDIDIGNGPESNTDDVETRISGTYKAGGTSQAADHSTTHISETGSDVGDVKELGSGSVVNIECEANASDAETQNLHILDTSMAGDTNQAAHSTPKSGTKMSEKRLKCDQCPYASNNSGHLKIHIRIHTGEKPFKCSQCSFAGVSSTDLKRHMQTHIGEKPYKCSQCSFACAQFTDLKTHMRTHTGEKPYKCSRCLYATAQLGNLKAHMLTHTGEKPYKCSQCSYATTHSTHLKEHIRTHTGEKPYKCDQCSFACADSTSLKRHMRIHTGEKPYKCSQCSFASAQSYDLKNHMRTHSGEKPYKCTQCSYVSALFSTLKNHMRTHSGKKPYMCSQCSFAAARADALKRHSRTHI